MFLRLDRVLYIWGHLFNVYVTLLMLIVLYSRSRVNRGPNLFVVLYDVIYFRFASIAISALCRRSQPVGCIPTVADAQWQAPRLGPATGSVASERQTPCGQNYLKQRNHYKSGTTK